jgi:hypothetical protein
MSDGRTRPWTVYNQRQANSHLCWRQRVLWLARRFVVALLVIFSLAGIALAQTQSESTPAPQSQSKPLPRKTSVSTVADAARNAKSKADEPAP